MQSGSNCADDSDVTKSSGISFPLQLELVRIIMSSCSAVGSISPSHPLASRPGSTGSGVIFAQTIEGLPALAKCNDFRDSGAIIIVKNPKKSECRLRKVLLLRPSGL
jgi:hypothetical protein